MSFFFQALSNFGESLKTGFSRIKEGARAFLQLLRPRDRVKCLPHANMAVDDLRDRVIVISRPQPVACPSVLPMMTPPIQECLTGEMRKGSQSARALFLDPFRPLSPMGVFEISSNAFSPSIEDLAAISPSTNVIQSPLSSNGNDSQHAGVFDQANSPSQVSTAPTTPASDFYQLSDPYPTENNFAIDYNGESEGSDDIPLSALMIRGVVRAAAKRNGISGNLLSNRKDAPLWIPNLSHDESRPPDGENQREVDDLDGYAEGSRLDVGTHPRVSDVDDPQFPRIDTSTPPLSERPLNTTWCDTWAHNPTWPSNDEESVYSLDSFVPSPSPRRESRMRGISPILPQITLTRPTSPALTPSNTIPLFDDTYLASSDIEEPSAARFKPRMLSVPLQSPVPRLECGDGDVDDEEDESLIKRRRRNACRLNTSSIDIIMAGLDQEFPDTPVTSPLVTPAVLAGDDPDIFRLDSQELVKPLFQAAVSYPPSSPSTTLRNSLCDTSGETLLMDDELESKFSDSSDEEQETFPKLANPKKHGGRLSWPVSQTSLFSPRSALATIAEEEEDGGNPSRGFTPLDASADDTHLDLEPSAMIQGTSRTPKAKHPYRPVGKISKKRWFSMIEEKSRQPTPLGGPRRKHMSAPPLTYPNTLSHPRLHSGNSSGALPRLHSQKSAIRPLILPRSITPQSGSLEDCGPRFSVSSNPSEDFGLPSSRSSSCISLYQRPWSLYVPVEAVEHCAPFSGLVGTNDSRDVLSPSQDDPSPRNGLDSILAILDTLNFAPSSAESLPGDAPGSAAQACSREADFRRTDSDLEACSGDSVGSDFFAGIAV